MTRRNGRDWRKRKLRKSARKLKINWEASVEVWNKELRDKKSAQIAKQENNQFKDRIPKKSHNTVQATHQPTVTVHKPRHYRWKPNVFVEVDKAHTLPLT